MGRSILAKGPPKSILIDFARLEAIIDDPHWHWTSFSICYSRKHELDELQRVASLAAVHSSSWLELYGHPANSNSHPFFVFVDESECHFVELIFIDLVFLSHAATATTATAATAALALGWFAGLGPAEIMSEVEAILVR